MAISQQADGQSGTRSAPSISSAASSAAGATALDQVLAHQAQPVTQSLRLHPPGPLRHFDRGGHGPVRFALPQLDLREHRKAVHPAPVVGGLIGSQRRLFARGRQIAEAEQGLGHLDVDQARLHITGLGRLPGPA